MTYVYIAVGVVIAALSGALWFQTQRLEVAHEERGAWQATANSLEHAVSVKDAEIQRGTEARTQLAQDKAILNDQLTKNLRTLDTFRDASGCLDQPVDPGLGRLLNNAHTPGGGEADPADRSSPALPETAPSPTADIPRPSPDPRGNMGGLG